MAEFETRFERFDSRVSKVERQVSVIETKVDKLVDEFRDFKSEIRQQNQMRANEIRDLQKKQELAQAKHDSDMRDINKKIDDKFDKISSQLQTMALTTILGVGAIVWAIVSAHK